MSKKILWYIADPMCSWCWGFMPVMDEVRKTVGDRMRLEIVPGGLRPGTKDPLPAAQREEILHHWHTVHRKTGQPFRFEGALPAGFIYDTEPASRAVVVASAVNPDWAFALFKAIQSAFYVEQRDVTHPDVLGDLAAEAGLDAASFSRAFASDEAKSETAKQFGKARQWGVRGFPTVIGQSGEDYTRLANGYCPFDMLQPRLDAWLGKE